MSSGLERSGPEPSMRLADLAATSRLVADTRARSRKTAALADLLRRLGAEEIAIAVAFPSGHLRPNLRQIRPLPLPSPALPAAPAAPRLPGGGPLRGARPPQLGRPGSAP